MGKFEHKPPEETNLVPQPPRGSGARTVLITLAGMLFIGGSAALGDHPLGELMGLAAGGAFAIETIDAAYNFYKGLNAETKETADVRLRSLLGNLTSIAVMGGVAVASQLT